MKKNITAIIAMAGALMVSTQTFAQTNAGVDPACVVKNTDGTETVDKAKCPDGMKVGGTASTSNNADTTASTSPAGAPMFVPPNSFANGKVMSANDFIGKTVYSKDGNNIGEVNDLIVADNGGVQAVILGVGGFLGIGEKDVAVSMNSINMTQDGNSVRLVVDGTKEQFNAAPSYDRTTRRYVQ